MPTLTMSKRFQFGEVSAYSLPSDDESGWQAVPLDGTAQRVTDKWIYVFQTSSAGSASSPSAPPKLFRACFADSAGNVHVFDAARITAPVDQQPDPMSISGVEALSLPDFIDGAQFYYYFFASRAALGPNGIAALESKVAAWFEPVNLPDLDYIANYVAAPTAFDFVPVLDPLTIAENLQETYEGAADLVVERNGDTDDMSPEAREDSKRRAARRMLGYYLRGILEPDVKNDFGISDKDEVLARIAAAEADDKQSLKRLTDDAEAKAKLVIRWLSGSIWQFVESSFREQEIQSYDVYINALANATARLVESSAGKNYLSQFEAKQPFVFHEYVARETLIPDAKSNTARRSGGAIVSILTSLVGFLMTVEKDPVKPNKLALVLFYVAKGAIVVEKAFGAANLAVRDVNGDTTLLTQLVGLAKGSHVVVHDFDVWTRRKKMVTDVISLFVDTVNAAFNLKQCMSDLDKKNGEALLSAAKGGKASAAVANAFVAIRKERSGVELKYTKATIGVVAAVADIIIVGADGRGAAAAHDWDRLVGDTFKITGSTLSALSGIEGLMKWAGLSSRAGEIGFFAGLLVIAGSLIVDFFSDTDLNTFVKNGSFGSNHLKSDFTPPWSTDNVSAWTDDSAGLLRQLDALYTLTCAFRVQAAGPNRVQIDVGNVTSDSRVFVEFHSEYALSQIPGPCTLNPRLRIDPMTGRVDEATQDPVKLSGACNVGAARVTLEVGIDWPNGVGPDLPNQSTAPAQPASTTVDVWLDVFGNGSKMIPRDGPLRCLIYQDPSIFDTVFSSLPRS